MGTDFFKVNAWEERGKLCKQYLSKGKKVCVIGSVSVRTYTGSDGTVRANLEVKADEVEFLSSGERREPLKAEPDPIIDSDDMLPV